MRLTPPPGTPARHKTITGPRALTTEPGFSNPNRQIVVRGTGAPSTTRSAQTIYALRCGDCDHLYGCNGLDIKDRRCPACQGGQRGEPLREPPPLLFE